MPTRPDNPALALALALAFCAAGGACGPPEPPSPPPSEIAAWVDGQPVTADELRAAAHPRARDGGEVDWQDALESWVDARIVADELNRRGLHESETYRERVAAIRARAWRSAQTLARDTLIADVERSLELGDDELRARYDEQRDRFLTSRMHLRQISVPDRETIRAIRRRIEQGEDFARLAAEANLDPALRRNGGDLGWIEQRRMPTAMIGPAHRLLAPGDVSEPFQDREGRWNLVQLVARDQGVRREFEDVKDQLERELRLLRGREILAELVKERRAAVSARLAEGP